MRLLRDSLAVHDPTGDTLTIDLGNVEPIARGGKRDIYEFPGDKAKILKVISDRRQQKQASRSALERTFKPRYEWEFIREIQTVYRASLVRRDGRPMPVISSAGLVQTTKGLGLSCEKITRADGGLARNLASFLEAPDFEQYYLPRLNAFISDIFDFQIVASDLNCSNIVFFEQEDRFVAIDGFGSRTLIPIMTWSRMANDRQLNQKIREKIEARTRLVWDARTHKFSV